MSHLVLFIGDDKCRSELLSQWILLQRIVYEMYFDGDPSLPLCFRGHCNTLVLSIGAHLQIFRNLKIFYNTGGL